MTGEQDHPDVAEPADGTHLSRLQMLTDVLVFEFKLVADGLRDLLLSPLALIAAAMGLISGGDRPDQYFRKVLRFGRRTETWINLFGRHRGPGTADHLVDPLRTKVIDEVQANRWLNKAGTSLNKRLDGMNSTLSTRASGPADPIAPTPRSTDDPAVKRGPG